MDTGLYFSCQIGSLPAKTLDVVEFKLQEALSSLFTLTLTVVSQDPTIPLDEQLLQKASLTIYAEGAPKRTINGIIASAEQGEIGFKRTYYTFVIQPKLWLLTLTQNSRIFHFNSVPDILNQLLQEHNVDNKKQLDDPHITREYVTQKRESDYDFFCRLAAEEGITFWFEEEGLFYSDSHLGMTANLPIIYNPHPQSAHRESVIDRLRFGVFMRPNQALIKDYKYSHPDVPLKFESKPQQPVKQPTYRVYDSYGRFDDDKVGKQFSRYRLEALRADSEQGLADSNCIELMPGKIFTLTEHPNPAMNTRWQVVNIEHSGHLPQSLADESDGSPASLSNTFTFISGLQDWRPPFKHKPTADGDEVAKVVGPAGEEIYVNEDGCVRVHFHWNLYDAPDENASCWVRVALGWNGDGFGFVSIPRIGQEVVVSYLNGDIDRPIITGCTYNGKNRPPLNLPADKTSTSIKTKTHKGGGYNELRFDDTDGKQQIGIHAQYDMNTKVLNNRSTTVLQNHTENITLDQTIDIGKDQTVHIVGHQKTTIDATQNIIIASDQNQTIEGTQHISVTGAQGTHYKASHTLDVDATEEITVKGTQAITVIGDQTTTLKSNHTLDVTSNETITVGGNQVIDVTGNQDHLVTGAQLHDAKTITLDATDSITLKCGSSSITLDSSGNITINGVEINSIASGENTVIGSVLKLNP